MITSKTVAKLNKSKSDINLRMPTELREFVYLDSMSVNSLLASLGEPVPHEQIQVNETVDEGGTEAGIEAGLSVPGFGKLGGNFNLSDTQTGREMLKTGKRINDQYTFHTLHEQLREEDEVIALPEEREDLSGAGDVVKLNGTVSSDPLFRLMNTASLFSRLDDSIDTDDLEPILRLYGTQIPLVIDPTSEDGFSYGIAIDESYLWGDARREFLGNKKYTVFGRVTDVLSSRQEWDTIDLLRIARTVLSDESVDEIRNALSGLMEALGQTQQAVEMPDTDNMSPEDLQDDEYDTEESIFEMDIEDYNFTVEGRAIIIDPIAIYV